MPHNQHTRRVHDELQVQIVRQEKLLAALAKKLKSEIGDSPEIPVVNIEKVRRSTRIEQKRRLKANRRGNADENQK